MNPSVLHPLPGLWNVLEAQLRAVWIALRGVAIAAASATVAATVVLSFVVRRSGEGIPFDPELTFLIASVAPLLPLVVWKGEYRLRRSYLASLPVDRAQHALAKIAAGWVWLMVLLVAFLLWMLGLAVVTGGDLGVYLRVMAADVPAGATAEEAVALARRWTTPAWQWAVFFTSTTVSYLFGSAVVLAGSRTRRWLAGLVIGCLFFRIVVDEAMGLGEAGERLEMAFWATFEGRYGLETLVAGRQGPVQELRTAAGAVVSLWRAPAVEVWVLTTLLWSGLAAASLAAVLRRNRED